MTPEKQHPDSINRDLDDEVAEAIEHQYAGKLRPAGKTVGRKADKDAIEAEIERLRQKSRS
jgi:hypothetical protein